MDPEIGVRVHIKHGSDEWDNRNFGDTVHELKQLVEVSWDKKLSYAFPKFSLTLFSKDGYYKDKFSYDDEVTIYHYKKSDPNQDKEYVFGLIEDVKVEEKAPNEDYVFIEGSGYLVRLADVLHKKRTIYKDQECSSLIKYMVDSARDAGEIDITTGGVQLTDTVIPEIDFPYMPLLKALQKIKKLATNAEGKFYDLRLKHKDLEFAVKGGGAASATLEDLKIISVKRLSTETKYRVFVSGAVEPYPEGGDLCEGNATNTEIQKCYANACDILAGSQISGDYTKTFASDNIYHRLRSQSTLYNDPITQPSFESAGGWSYSEYDPDNCFSGRRMTWWKTHGSYAYEIRTAESDNPAGAYGMLSQSIDLTDVKTIVFDARSLFWGDDWAVEVLIDGTVKWSKTAEQTHTYMNQSIDVSGYSGYHHLRFRFRCVRALMTAGYDYFAFDNIRLYTQLLKIVYHFKTLLDRAHVIQVKVHVEGHTSAGSCSIYVYNYTDSAWGLLGTIDAGADNIVEQTFSVDPEEYMDANGNMKLKAETKRGNTWDLYIDYTYMEVTATIEDPLPDSEVWDCTNGTRDDDSDSVIGGYSVKYDRDNLGLEGKLFFNKSKNLNWDLKEAAEGLRRVDFWLKSDHNHAFKLRLHRTYGNYWERSLTIENEDAWQHFQFETGEKSSGWVWNGAGEGWDGINTFEIVVTDNETDIIKIDGLHHETPIMVKAEDINLIDIYGLREKEPVDGGTESEEGAQQIADRLLALLKDPKTQVEAKGRLRMDVDLGDVVPFDRPDSDLYGNFMIYEMTVKHPSDGLSEIDYTFGSESPSLEAELASLQGGA